MVLDYLNLQEYLTQVEDVLPSTTQAEVLVALRSLSQRVEYLPSDSVEQRYVFLTNGMQQPLDFRSDWSIESNDYIVFSPQHTGHSAQIPHLAVCVGDSVSG